MIKLKQFYFVLSSVNRNFAAPSYLRLTIKIKNFILYCSRLIVTLLPELKKDYLN